MNNYVPEQPPCLTSHAYLHSAIGYQPNRNLKLSRGRHLVVTFARNTYRESRISLRDLRTTTVQHCWILNGAHRVHVTRARNSAGRSSSLAVTLIRNCVTIGHTVQNFKRTGGHHYKLLCLLPSLWIKESDIKTQRKIQQRRENESRWSRWALAVSAQLTGAGDDFMHPSSVRCTMCNNRTDETLYITLSS
jgi:hypothetical protein